MNSQTPKLLISMAQIFFFILLPFLWWFITAREEIGFFRWIRLKRDFSSEETKRTLWIAGITVVFLAVLVFFHYAAKSIETAASELLSFGLKALPAVVIYAALNTSLPEKLIAKAKPSLFEQKGRSPGIAFFSVNACAEQVTGADGRRYKALALFTLCVSDKADPFAAESFLGPDTEETLAMLADPLDSALRSLIEEYGGTADFEALAAEFRKKADQAIETFGVSVFRVNEIKVMEEE